MTLDIFLELAKIGGAVLGAWFAVRIELRWLRSDVDKLDRRVDRNETRIHALEVKK